MTKRIEPKAAAAPLSQRWTKSASSDSKADFDVVAQQAHKLSRMRDRDGLPSAIASLSGAIDAFLDAKTVFEAAGYPPMLRSSLDNGLFT